LTEDLGIAILSTAGWMVILLKQMLQVLQMVSYLLYVKYLVNYM